MHAIRRSAPLILLCSLLALGQGFGQSCPFNTLDLSRPYYPDSIRCRYDSIKFVKRSNVSDGSVSDSSANPRAIECKGKLDCIDAKFVSYTDLSQAQFDTIVNLNGGKFFNDLDFSNSTIPELRMDGAEITREIRFINTVFGHKVYFSNLELRPSTRLYLQNATLPDSLYFSHDPAIPFEIDLTVAAHYSDRQTGLYLYKTDISKFRFDYKYFKLIFSDERLHEVLSDEDKKIIYEAALKNFKDRGQLESFEKLDIEYQTFRRGRFAWLPFIWYCYGYEKWLIFPWTFGLLLAFSILNYFCLEKMNDDVYPLLSGSDLGILPWNVNSWTGIGRRFWYSLYFTACVFFPFSIQIEKIKYREIGGTIYLFVMYGLGIVCLGYMANFVLQK